LRSQNLIRILKKNNLEKLQALKNDISKFEAALVENYNNLDALEERIYNVNLFSDEHEKIKIKLISLTRTYYQILIVCFLKKKMNHP